MDPPNAHRVADRDFLFTFQALSYVIDVFRGKGTVQRSLTDVALHISLFPQLVAGPIVRYGTISKEIAARNISTSDFLKGFQRFIIGLSKKVMLANTMAMLADHAFALDSRVALFAWTGALAYAFQIYFDFSGYSDMAIGLGLLLGFHFEENFRYPYAAKSLGDFWRRWHISMSTWFRDYLYIPLGGSRVASGWRYFRNLMIVWIVTGVWHGANWTFILWGLIYELMIYLEMRFLRANQDARHRAAKALHRAFALLVVLVQWVIFRSPTLTAAWHYICDMFSFGQETLYDQRSLVMLREYGPYLLIAFLCSLPLFPWVKQRLSRFGRAPLYRFRIVLGVISCVLMLLVSIAILVQSKYNPFIYFNF